MLALVASPRYLEHERWLALGTSRSTLVASPRYLKEQ